MKRIFRLRGLLLGAVCVFGLSTVHAQYLRTSYFMEGAYNRLQLNPALVPSRGFVGIPGLGNVNAALSSNSLGTQDIIDCIGSTDYFFNNDNLYSKLKDINELNATASVDIINFGFVRGKGFWSFNVGVRADANASIHKSMFDYLRKINRDDFSWSNANIDIQNEELKINTYTEVGVGYARQLNKKLTVGGKVKILLGMGNMNLKVNKLSLQSNIPDYYDPNASMGDISASIQSDAVLEGNMRGLELTESTGYDGNKSYVDGLEVNSFGVGGYGAGIDLGASYQLTKDLTLSAAVIDLGFISWSKGSSVIAKAETDAVYDETNYQDFLYRAETSDVIDFNLIGLEIGDEKKARTTRLCPTLVLGGEYAFLNDKLSAGVLSTTRFGLLKTTTELTLSANYRPNTLIGLSASYSMIQSAGKSFGLAFKLGPFLLGTDYMYLGDNSKSVNAFIGISVPLAKL